ncbi:hypothetical protein SAMN05216198_1004 [Halopseudomonas litoralis]|uniref:Uncharacterized protein n=1 Tax=Halopseudomonas litoralis TaxID=797277 RepID=A0A1H1NT94_9GAMM|nr:hypothetical protein [Halopseudomonas litoralis]SDS02163.1 hypothetical protein SAMN05216198_1004 [Halopseudomonas litoralis]
MSIQSRLAKLISDDSYAATFQSLGQYRAALLQAAAGEMPEGEENDYLQAGHDAIDAAMQSHPQEGSGERT